MKVALEKARVELQNKINELETVKKSIEGEVKLKTKELLEEQARLLASINSLPLGFVITDSNFNLILKNIAIEKMLGISGIEFFMDNFSKKLEINPESLADQLMKENKKIIVKNINLERMFMRLFFSPVNLSVDSGKTIGYVFMTEDVTEQERLERARSEFFAIASHELRTPLTVIRGNMVTIKQFYSDKMNDKDLIKMINSSYDSSVHLIQLVNDFLDVSSLELNKIKFNVEKVDLPAVIKEASDELANIAKFKGLALAVKNSADNPIVLADRQRTKQIFINLISNAINYTNKGSVSIELANRDNYVEVTISDTGVGIAFENQPLLFRKFQQAGSDIYTRDVTQGTGLGLYISRLLVEGMGGKIELVKSEVGKGSVFRFTLPTNSK